MSYKTAFPMELHDTRKNSLSRMQKESTCSTEAPSASQAMAASTVPDQPSLQLHFVSHLHFIAELALSVSYCTFIFLDQFPFDFPCL